MSLNNLSEQERYILLELSYLDIPSIYEPKNDKSFNLNEIIYGINRDALNTGQQKKYDQIFDYMDSNKHSPLHGLNLTGYQNNNPNNGNNSNGESRTGFVGYALTDNEGNGTALFRGSEMAGVGDLATDWVSNVEAGIGITIQQQREANEFYERYLKGLDGEQYVFGHSKGGNLAEYVLVNNLEDERLTSYVVNGAPLYYWMLTQEQKDALRDRNTFIVHEGDVVSSIGYAPYVDRTVAINKEDGDPLYAHGLESVNFNPQGDFENSSEGASLVRNIANPIAATIILAVSLHPKVVVYRAAAAIRDATLYILEATKRGLEKAANYIKDQAIKFISKVKELSQKVKDEINQFLTDVAKKAAIAFVKLVAKVGGYFPVEPYLKVNIDRLYYHAARLENLKRRVNALNDRIDSLYWEVDLFDIDNILRADILTSFNYRLNQNINYLQNAAQLLEHNESKLVGKARIIR